MPVDLLTIDTVTTPGSDLEAVKALFQEYQAFLGIPLDFQNFDAELASLPGKFAPPDGRLYLAKLDNGSNSQPVGCVAYYRFSEDTCELKRLYVKPDCQGKALGRQLFERAIQDAKAQGYRRMVLDSLRRLDKAEKLYIQFGFTEIPPYNTNPHTDVYYMEKIL